MSFRKTKRVISLLIIFCLFGSDILRANPTPALSLEAVQVETAPKIKIELPPELGTVQEIYFPAKQANQANAPFVVHIQTLHAHYETSLQVQKILQFLNQQYGIQKIFAEGASEDLHPEYLNFQPDQELNQKIANTLAEKGELTGVDLALQDPSLHGAGIEDPKLYQQAFRTFQKVIGNQNENEKALEADRRELDKIASKVLSPETKKFFGDWLKFESGHRDFTATLKLLREEGKKILQLDLENPLSQFDWPELTRLVHLQELEKREDLEQLEIEKEKFEKWLTQHQIKTPFLSLISKENLSGSVEKALENKSPREIVEGFYEQTEKLGFQFSEYPQITYRAASITLQSELDSKDLFQEFEKLFALLLEGKIKANDERTLLQKYQKHVLMGKLLQLELSPEDWAKVKALAMFGEEHELQLPGADLKEALKFYELMEKRDAVFLSKIESNIGNDKQRKANRLVVLVTGGFHAKGVEAGFKKQKMGYAVITPHIAGDLNSSLYHKIMMRSAHMEKPEFLQPAVAFSRPAYTRAETRVVLETLKDFGISPNPFAPYFSDRNSFLKSESSEARSESRVKLSDRLGPLVLPNGQTIQTFHPETGLGKHAESLLTALSELKEDGILTSDMDVLDVGSGDGKVLVSIANHVKSVTGVEINPHLAELSRQNIETNGLGNAKVFNGDLFEPLKGRKFDLIVSNPPALPIPSYRELKVKPHSEEIGDVYNLANNGGPSGREILDRILTDAPNYLTPNGKILLVHNNFLDLSKTEKKAREMGFEMRVVKSIEVKIVEKPGTRDLILVYQEQIKQAHGINLYIKGKHYHYRLSVVLLSPTAPNSARSEMRSKAEKFERWTTHPPLPVVIDISSRSEVRSHDAEGPLSRGIFYDGLTHAQIQVEWNDWNHHRSENLRAQETDASFVTRSETRQAFQEEDVTAIFVLPDGTLERKRMRLDTYRPKVPITVDVSPTEIKFTPVKDDTSPDKSFSDTADYILQRKEAIAENIKDFIDQVPGADKLSFELFPSGAFVRNQWYPVFELPIPSSAENMPEEARMILYKDKNGQIRMPLDFFLPGMDRDFQMELVRFYLEVLLETDEENFSRNVRKRNESFLFERALFDSEAHVAKSVSDLAARTPRISTITESWARTFLNPRNVKAPEEDATQILKELIIRELGSMFVGPLMRVDSDKIKGFLAKWFPRVDESEEFGTRLAKAILEYVFTSSLESGQQLSLGALILGLRHHFLIDLWVILNKGFYLPLLDETIEDRKRIEYEEKVLEFFRDNASPVKGFLRETLRAHDFLLLQGPLQSYSDLHDYLEQVELTDKTIVVAPIAVKIDGVAKLSVGSRNGWENLIRTQGMTWLELARRANDFIEGQANDLSALGLEKISEKDTTDNEAKLNMRAYLLALKKKRLQGDLSYFFPTFFSPPGSVSNEVELYGQMRDYLGQLRKFQTEIGASKVIVAQPIVEQGARRENADVLQKPTRNTDDLFQQAISRYGLFGRVRNMVYISYNLMQNTTSELYPILRDWQQGSFAVPVKLSDMQLLNIAAQRSAGDAYVFGNFDDAIILLESPRDGPPKPALISPSPLPDHSFRPSPGSQNPKRPELAPTGRSEARNGGVSKIWNGVKNFAKGTALVIGAIALLGAIKEGHWLRIVVVAVASFLYLFLKTHFVNHMKIRRAIKYLSKSTRPLYQYLESLYHADFFQHRKLTLHFSMESYHPSKNRYVRQFFDLGSGLRTSVYFFKPGAEEPLLRIEDQKTEIMLYQNEAKSLSWQSLAVLYVMGRGLIGIFKKDSEIFKPDDIPVSYDEMNEVWGNIYPEEVVRAITLALPLYREFLAQQKDKRIQREIGWLFGDESTATSRSETRSDLKGEITDENLGTIFRNAIKLLEDLKKTYEWNDLDLKDLTEREMPVLERATKMFDYSEAARQRIFQDYSKAKSRYESAIKILESKYQIKEAAFLASQKSGKRIGVRGAKNINAVQKAVDEVSDAHHRRDASAENIWQAANYLLELVAVILFEEIKKKVKESSRLEGAQKNLLIKSARAFIDSSAGGAGQSATKQYLIGVLTFLDRPIEILTIYHQLEIDDDEDRKFKTLAPIDRARITRLYSMPLDPEDIHKHLVELLPLPSQLDSVPSEQRLTAGQNLHFELTTYLLLSGTFQNIENAEAVSRGAAELFEGNEEIRRLHYFVKLRKANWLLNEAPPNQRSPEQAERVIQDALKDWNHYLDNQGGENELNRGWKLIMSAMASFYRGASQEALQALEEAYKMESNDIQKMAVFIHILVLSKMGDVVAAQEKLKEYLSLIGETRSKHAGIWEHYTEFYYLASKERDVFVRLAREILSHVDQWPNDEAVARELFLFLQSFSPQKTESLWALFGVGAGEIERGRFDFTQHGPAVKELILILYKEDPLRMRLAMEELLERMGERQDPIVNELKVIYNEELNRALNGIDDVLDLTLLTWPVAPRMLDNYRRKLYRGLLDAQFVTSDYSLEALDKFQKRFEQRFAERSSKEFQGALTFYFEFWEVIAKRIKTLGGKNPEKFNRLRGGIETYLTKVLPEYIDGRRQNNLSLDELKSSINFFEALLTIASALSLSKSLIDTLNDRIKELAKQRLAALVAEKQKVTAQSGDSLERDLKVIDLEIARTRAYLLKVSYYILNRHIEQRDFDEARKELKTAKFLRSQVLHFLETNSAHFSPDVIRELSDELIESDGHLSSLALLFIISSDSETPELLKRYVETMVRLKAYSSLDYLLKIANLAWSLRDTDTFEVIGLIVENEYSLDDLGQSLEAGSNFYLKLANLQKEKGKDAQAQVLFGKARELLERLEITRAEEDNAKTNFSRLQELYFQGDYSEALQTAERLRAGSLPKDLEVSVPTLETVIYLSLGQPENALAAIQSTLPGVPDEERVDTGNKTKKKSQGKKPKSATKLANKSVGNYEVNNHFANVFFSLRPDDRDRLTNEYLALLTSEKGRALELFQIKEIIFRLRLINPIKLEEKLIEYLFRHFNEGQEFHSIRDPYYLFELGKTVSDSNVGLAYQLTLKALQSESEKWKLNRKTLQKQEVELKKRLNPQELIGEIKVALEAGEYDVAETLVNTAMTLANGGAKDAVTKDALQGLADQARRARDQYEVVLRKYHAALTPSEYKAAIGAVGELGKINPGDLNAKRIALNIRVLETATKLIADGRRPSDRQQARSLLVDAQNTDYKGIFAGQAIPEPIAVFTARLRELSARQSSPLQKDEKIEAGIISLVEFESVLPGIKQLVQERKFRAANAALDGALSKVVEIWPVDTFKEYEDIKEIQREIDEALAEIGNLITILDTADHFRALVSSARNLARFPEEVDRVAEVLLKRAEGSFLNGSKILLPKGNLPGVRESANRPVLDLSELNSTQRVQREQKFQKAFHFARLIVELSKDIEISKESLQKARIIISQASSNIWLPRFVDNYFIVRFMAEADKARDALADQYRRLAGLDKGFEFNFGRLERFSDKIELSNFLDLQENGALSRKGLNIGHAIRAGDSIVLSTPQKGDVEKEKLPYVFKVREVLDGRLVLDFPKSQDGREQIMKAIEPLKKGGLMSRLQNDSWHQQEETLDKIIGGLTRTTRSSLGDGELSGRVPLASTGFSMIDFSLGLRLPEIDTNNGAISSRRNALSVIVDKEKQLQGKSLDPSQQEAILDAIDDEKKVTFIQGPGGTGKTEVISYVARIMHDLKVPLVISSQQNKAVDNVGMRFLREKDRDGQDRKIPFARLGNNGEPISDAEIREIWDKRDKIVAELAQGRRGAILLGTVNGLLNDGTLSQDLLKSVRVLIIDEASRATLPEVLNLIRRLSGLNKVIFVGDHFQLPAYGISEQEIVRAKDDLRSNDRIRHGVAAAFEGQQVYRSTEKIFERASQDLLRRSVLEQGLALFEVKPQGIEDSVFSLTQPPFTFLRIQRRSGRRIVELDNYHYREQGSLEPGREDPGTVIEDDTSKLKGGKHQGKDAGRYAEETAEDEVSVNRANSGEVDRIVTWVSHLLNGRVKRRDKDGNIIQETIEAKDIAIITPYQGQVDLTNKALDVFSKIHNLLITVERTGISSESLEADLQELLGNRFVKKRVLSQGASTDFDLRSFNSRKAKALREQLGLGENFITPDDLANGAIKVITVDSSIGHEYKAVILSWVRSNPDGNVGFLRGGIDGQRRRNVATARAEHILIWIWNQETFAKGNGQDEFQKWGSHTIKSFNNFRNEDILNGFAEDNPEWNVRSETRGKPDDAEDQTDVELIQTPAELIAQLEQDKQDKRIPRIIGVDAILQWKGQKLSPAQIRDVLRSLPWLTEEPNTNGDQFRIVQPRKRKKKDPDSGKRSEVRSQKPEPGRNGKKVAPKHTKKLKTHGKRGLTYEEVRKWLNKVKRSQREGNPILLPYGFWTHPDTIKNAVLVVLDKNVSGFKKAREQDDFQEMANLYRKNVLHHKPKDKERFSYVSRDPKTGDETTRYITGQYAFFYEFGLRAPLTSKSKIFGGKNAYPIDLLRLALPKLLEQYLDPREIQGAYWTKKENAIRHAFQALDTIPGFRKAREDKDVKEMVKLYREYVFKYKAQRLQFDGQHAFFIERGNLSSFFHRPPSYAKKGNVATLLKLTKLGLVDDSNPEALQSWEVERPSDKNDKVRKAISADRRRLTKYLQETKGNGVVVSEISVTTIGEWIKNLKPYDIYLILKRTEWLEEIAGSKGNLFRIKDQAGGESGKADAKSEVRGASPDLNVSGIELPFLAGDGASLIPVVRKIVGPDQINLSEYLVPLQVTVGIARPRLPRFQEVLTGILRNLEGNGKSEQEITDALAALSDKTLDSLADSPKITEQPIFMQIMQTALAEADRAQLENRLKTLPVGSVVILYADQKASQAFDLGRLIPAGVRYERKVYSGKISVSNIQEDRKAVIQREQTLENHSVLLISDSADLDFEEGSHEEQLEKLGFVLQLDPTALRKQPRILQSRIVPAITGSAIALAKQLPDERNLVLSNQLDSGAFGNAEGAFVVHYDAWLEQRMSQLVARSA